VTFGKRICFLRLRIGKSQKRIEAETGIPQRTLSDWENDKSEPKVSDLPKLASALGISTSELIGDQPTLPKTG